jgi:HEAT repeat protein
MRGLLLVLGVVLLTNVPNVKGEGAAQVRQLLKELKSDNGTQRQLAIRELMKLGPRSGDAVPVLIAALSETQGEVRQIVTNVLGNIGKTAVPALAAALDSPKPGVRRQACIALARIGADATDAVPVLKKTVNDRDR